ncbi:uncharacterized protein [Ambystoma mexicanum]|uniref:uncharacterized protein n=1 Tax=Ambystoma mexicanum TaxID=8296 RepID=UPI0037E9A806
MKESTVFDICSSRGATIPPRKRGMIPTTSFGLLYKTGPTSDLAWKFGLDVLAGVIDPDLRGDIKVLLQNHGEILFEKRPGDKIGQGILEKAQFPHFEEDTDPEETERGNIDFGEAVETRTTRAKGEDEPTILPDLAFAQQNNPIVAEAFLQVIP